MQCVYKFQPILKERPWGGQAIARVGKNRKIPVGRKIGESWEISDRDGNESVIANGEFQGKTLRWLLDERGEQVMGNSWKRGRRFPLLVKILDAAERLSLQVHPPVHVANELQGEPKTEMWYLLDATPEAAILAGLKKGVSREDFENKIHSGKIESLIHRIPVKKGQAIFIPSGRVHAIDAGCLILEIQQNSDTTYRVSDWGRVGLDDKPREIHLEASLKSIDFEDHKPELISIPCPIDSIRSWRLVACENFTVDWIRVSCMPPTGYPVIIHVLRGSLEIRDEKLGVTEEVKEGESMLLAAAFRSSVVAQDGKTEIIHVTWPTA